MRAEHERLGDFETAGFQVPPSVSDGLSDLASWIAAFDLGTHALGTDERYWSVAYVADWLTEGTETWLGGGQAAGKALEPLQLAPPADRPPVETLSTQLIVILENLERTARIPQYVLLFGLLLALARVETTRARAAICATLDGIGIQRVGETLKEYSTRSLDGMQSRDFMLQILEAFNKFPPLLMDRSAADWLTSLALRQGWCYELAPFYIEQLDRVTAGDHRQAVDLARAIRDRERDLETVFNDTQAATSTFDGTARSVWESMLDRLASVRSLVEDTLRQSSANSDTRQFFRDSFIRAA